ncbi:hypothetical protein C7S13_4724 [Burkholderia cepacia]|nr:hypothetical protein [Burkholderia cepacia]
MSEHCSFGILDVCRAQETGLFRLSGFDGLYNTFQFVQRFIEPPLR